MFYLIMHESDDNDMLKVILKQFTLHCFSFIILVKLNNVHDYFGVHGRFWYILMFGLLSSIFCKI